MKKIFFAVALLFASASAAQAQSFDVGSNNITVTTGIASGHGVPFAVSYEHGIASFAEDHKLGIGGYFTTANYYTFFGAECNYHYVGFEKFDIYGGARLGYRSLGKDNIHCDLGVGTNYFFAPQWAANVELATGVVPLSAGITFQF